MKVFDKVTGRRLLPEEIEDLGTVLISHLEDLGYVVEDAGDAEYINPDED